MSAPPANPLPDGCLASSRLGAELRLRAGEQATLVAVHDALRALETAAGAACVAILDGSAHERLLTRIGEVMLIGHLWEWYLRGRPSSAAQIVAEAPWLAGYVKARSVHMLVRLHDELTRETSEDGRRFLTERMLLLEHEVAALARMEA